jgi:hypothetical protein
VENVGPLVDPAETAVDFVVELAVVVAEEVVVALICLRGLVVTFKEFVEVDVAEASKIEVAVVEADEEVVAVATGLAFTSMYPRSSFKSVITDSLQTPSRRLCCGPRPICCNSGKEI